MRYVYCRSKILEEGFRILFDIFLIILAIIYLPIILPKNAAMFSIINPCKAEVGC